MTYLESEVVRVARAVRDRFARKDAPADLDDVEQDAAVAMLKAVREGKVDEDKNAGGYLWQVGKCQAGICSSKMLSKVTLPAKKAALARKFQRAVLVEGAGATEEDFEAGGAVTLVSERMASHRADALALAREELGRRVRQARIVERHALMMERPLDRRIVGALFGLGEEPPAEGGVPEVAFCLGITEGRAKAALRRLGDSLRGDPEMVALRHNTRSG